MKIPQILEKIQSLPNEEERLAFLSNFSRRRDLQWVVAFMYNTDLDCIKLNNLVKNYEPAKETFGTISSNIKKLEFIYVLFQKDEVETANRKLRIILESISAEEAELIYNIFSGRKGGVSKKLFTTTFPSLFQTK